MNKGSVYTYGNNVKLQMPIVKVNEATRTVSGFATLDNIDQEGDQILADASLRAFQRWRGNIREMHAPKAVGKALSFEERPYVTDDGTQYRGVYVDAYISTGAEDTWQKVLDGTLTGFSISGPIKDFESALDKRSGRPIRVVKDYDLLEVSLVDNPGNELANIMSIQKNRVTGITAETEILNVFYNKASDEVMLTKSEDPLDSEFTLLGWVEDNDSKYSQIKKLFEGGNEMPDSDKAAPVDEVVATTETPQLADLFKSFKTEVLDAIEKVRESNGEAISKSEATLEDLVTKVADFGTKQEEFAGKQGELEASLSKLDERLTAIEESGAVKKSQEVVDESDEDELPEHMDKVWRGKIFNRAEIFK